jgi:hypothetical protein
MASGGGSGGNTDGLGAAEDTSDLAVVVVTTREMGMGTPIGKDLTAGHSN